MNLSWFADSSTNAKWVKTVKRFLKTVKMG